MYLILDIFDKSSLKIIDYSFYLIISGRFFLLRFLLKIEVLTLHPNVLDRLEEIISITVGYRDLKLVASTFRYYYAPISKTLINWN